MREAVGNLWDKVQENQFLVITTNGDLTKEGRAVMGAGIAKEARDRHKGIDRILGHYYSNNLETILFARTRDTVYNLLFMPVKYHWRDPADPDLIVRSAHEMVDLVNKEERIYQSAYEGYETVVWLPRPGCGMGKLLWKNVRPLLEPILDDRFIAVSNE